MPSTLPVGRAVTLEQNTVYALHPKAVMATATAAIETSQDGTNFSPVTLTNNQSALSAIFIRSTLVGTIVSLKEFGYYAPSPSTSGANRSTFNFDYSNITTPPPTSSQVRLNALHPYTTVNKIYTRYVTNDGIDAKYPLITIPTNTTIYLQDKNDSSLYAMFTTSGPSLDKGTHVEIPVAWKQNGGSLINNQGILLVIIS